MSYRVPVERSRVPRLYPPTYKRWIEGYARAGFFVPTTVVARVYLVPINVPFDCFVDALMVRIDVQAGNMHIGLYRDNGYTPAGGALVVDSGSVAVPAPAGHNDISITETFLEAGLYWLAVEFSDATATWYWSNIYVYPLEAVYYDRVGGYGALIDPCPSITVADRHYYAWLRVSRMG